MELLWNIKKGLNDLWTYSPGTGKFVTFPIIRM